MLVAVTPSQTQEGRCTSVIEWRAEGLTFKTWPIPRLVAVYRGVHSRIWYGLNQYQAIISYKDPYELWTNQWNVRDFQHCSHVPEFKTIDWRISFLGWFGSQRIECVKNKHQKKVFFLPKVPVVYGFIFFSFNSLSAVFFSGRIFVGHQNNTWNPGCRGPNKKWPSSSFHFRRGRSSGGGETCHR